MVDEKICKVCGSTKSLQDFYKSGDRYQSYCKPCVREKAREYHWAHRESCLENKRKWDSEHREYSRDKAKEWAEKNPVRRKESARKYYQEHREENLIKLRQYKETHSEQISQYNKMYRAQNPEVVKEAQKAWWGRHPNYTKARRGKISAMCLVTSKDLYDLFTESSGLCHYCGVFVENAFFSPIQHKGFDHVVPIAKGGNHSKENLVVCCKTCNTRKGSMSYARFRERFCGEKVG